jgi:pimeloyl-ACP methyl ester carboxylesterase
MAELTVAGSGGVPLAVFTEGDPSAPPALLVHGYPDTHEVWDPVARILAQRHHVIRYDVRGAGASGSPKGLRNYRLPVLADDLFAVIAATSPDRPVLLVGHDWGSVQSWEAATDPRAVGRIAGYTTISGPCLDHVGHWARRRDKGRVGQTRRSWYIYAFHLPGMPTLVGRLLARQGRRFRATTVGVAVTLQTDAVNGTRLYRANMVRRMLRPRDRLAQVPVQLVTLAGDRFLTPSVVGDGLERWVPSLRRDTMQAGHWSALHTHADTLVELLEAFEQDLRDRPA